MSAISRARRFRSTTLRFTSMARASFDDSAAFAPTPVTSSSVTASARMASSRIKLRMYLTRRNAKKR